MLGYVYAVSLAIIWSVASIFYRYSVKESDALLITLIRIYPALAVTFIGVSIFDTVELAHLSNPLILFLAIVTSVCGLIIGSYAYIYAIKHAGIAITYPIAFSYPIYVSLITTTLMGEKVTIGLVIGLILQISGITLIAKSSNNNSNDKSLAGTIAAILASLSWAIQAILIKIALYHVNPLLFALDRVLVATIFSIPILWYELRKTRVLNKNEILSGMVGGSLGIGLAIMLYHLAIHYIGAARTTLISSSSPALSILLALIILKEKPNKFSLLGALSVSIALLTVILL